MDKNNIYRILETYGFRLINNESSNYFGDYYCIFTNNKIEIRFIRDRLDTFVELQNAIKGNNQWYDLDLVKNLLQNMDSTNTPMSIDLNIDFLINNLENVCILFNEKNYFSTQKQLETLRIERVKKMFPWYNP
jgi:3-isopropylmalate dehydratase small subunit